MTSISDNPLLEDIAFTWQQAEQDFRAGHHAESLVTQIRCALLHSTILTQQTSQLEDDLGHPGLVFTRLIPYFASNTEKSSNPETNPLVLEILDGLWKWQTAKNEMQRRSFLLDLVPYLNHFEREAIIEMILSTPYRYQYHDFIHLLRRLPTYLSPAHLVTLLEYASQRVLHERSGLLAGLAPYLSPDLLVKAWKLAQTTKNRVGLPSGIGEVAYYLPDDQWSEAFSILLTIENERSRVDAISEVMGRLSTAELDTVIENALAMQDGNARYTLLSRTISCLPEAQCFTLFTNLSALSDSSFFNRVLPLFARYMSPEWMPKLFDLVRTIEGSLYLRRNVLFVLASRLQGEAGQHVQQEALNCALELALQETDVEERAEALTDLLKYLDGDLRAEVLKKVLIEIDKLESEDRRDLLTELSWVLRDGEFKVILERIPHLLTATHQMAVVAEVVYSFPDSLLPHGMALVRVHKEHLWYGRDCEQLGSALASWAKWDAGAAYEEWKANLHAFAELPRVQLLTFLANMIPFAMSLAADEASQTAEGIYRVVKEVYARYM